MKKRLLILAAAVMTMAPLGASAAVFVGRGFYGRPFWGPGIYAGWGYPYGYGYYGYRYNSGEVKLHTKVKDAEVFINGAFAGDTHHNKTLHLRPGSYNLEIREAGHAKFTQRVFVAAGRTLNLYPTL